MLEEQLMKAATGLAFIIPTILFLRWFLGRKTGSPEEWGEYHIQELKKRYEKGDIDEETYKRRLEDLRES